MSEWWRTKQLHQRPCQRGAIVTLPDIRRRVWTTVHLIYRRTANLDGTCRRPNKAHSHATERTRTLPSLFKFDRFSFLSPRYFTSGNTIRHCPALSASFRVRFNPQLAIVHLSISLANASKRLIMRYGASATRIACCDSNHPPEEAERHSDAHNTRILYSTYGQWLIWMDCAHLMGISFGNASDEVRSC